MGWTQFERRIFFNIFATIFEDIPGWFLVPGIYNYSRTMTISNELASKCLLTYLLITVFSSEKNYEIFQNCWEKHFFKKKERNYTYILGIQFQTSQIFNGNKTTTAAVQTWRALVQTSKLGLIDLNPSSNDARKIIYFVQSRLNDSYPNFQKRWRLGKMSIFRHSSHTLFVKFLNESPYGP